MFRAAIGGILMGAAILLPTQPVVAASQLGEAWAKVRSFTIETKDAALEHGRALMRETDAKIKQLEDKAAESSGDARAAYQRSVADLKVKREQAATKLDDMGKATGSAWDATKNGFADAYKDLRESVDKTEK